MLAVPVSVALAAHEPVEPEPVEPAGTADMDTVETDAAVSPDTGTAELAAVDKSVELAAADKSAASAGMAMPAPVAVEKETTDAVGMETVVPESVDTLSAVRIADTGVAAAVALVDTGVEFAVE